jgi:hypothetical protein
MNFKVQIIFYLNCFKIFAEKMINKNSSLFNKFVCKLGFFWHEWAS